MDRNQVAVHFVGLSAVALRKESVDRNRRYFLAHPRLFVALRKESVDRNLDIDYYKTREHRSLSAMRAWIEMLLHCWSILH